MRTIALLFVAVCVGCAAPGPGRDVAATFSVVARDEQSGDLGIAVASKFIAVGAVVPWAKAGVGAVATQAWANTGYGPDGLILMGEGMSPREVIARLAEADERADHRQVGMVDFFGRSAGYTGEKCLGFAGHHAGKNYVVLGNLLAGPEVLEAMSTAFERTTGELSERLLAALAAGDVAGGDRRGKQSAALLVVRENGGYGAFNDRYRDLRVDDHEDPVRELQRIYAIHKGVFPAGE